MKPVSLIGVASHLPETIVGNDFFELDLDPAKAKRGPMFMAPTTRRHVRRDETAAAMIERAATKLIQQYNLKPESDIDILLTNVSVPDQAFTGCGAEVAKRLGANPGWVLDVHNTGCISFVYMLELAQMFMQTSAAKTALICNVQNAGGRVFAQSGVRNKPQAPIPGDGCGVGYVVASNESPILGVVHRTYGDFACDMRITADDQREYWEPGTSPMYVDFNDQRVAAIIRRGNSIVPDAIHDACRASGISPKQIDILVTNQPNPIFLRNWREALELPKQRHPDTFDRYGNLFGAAIPITLAELIESGQLPPSSLLALGGFSHAGDYAAAAIVHWRQAQQA